MSSSELDVYKPALVAGILFAAVAVILGAFGAHALKAIITEDQLKVFETGVRYQMYHSFALILTGVLYAFMPVKYFKIATILFVIGILLFSGSLYLITGLSAKGLTIGIGGIMTPIGGLFFILGWLQLLSGVLKK